MTRFFIKIFFGIVLTSLFSCAYAISDTETLTHLLNTIRSMQADFTQTVTDTKGKILNRSDGKMSLERPGKFRWEVARPNPQLIITNGRKIWIYDADLEQVTVRYLNQETSEAPALLLSNANETLAKDFQVQLASGPNAQGFLLTPKDKGSMFETIQLRFDNQQITQMQLQDHLGHVTMIQFKHVVTNNRLSPSLFQFKAPASVDVIDETRR
ncbi:MAG TPA: outer membrane lipoprotein chaperone LolA [Gammaproteobacteria bacterium]|nr:outer membrane lipoprotein chaperone LolA [Gammaproteobacteria bacterium]